MVKIQHMSNGQIGIYIPKHMHYQFEGVGRISLKLNEDGKGWTITPFTDRVKVDS